MSEILRNKYTVTNYKIYSSFWCIEVLVTLCGYRDKFMEVFCAFELEVGHSCNRPLHRGYATTALEYDWSLDMKSSYIDIGLHQNIDVWV